MLTASKGTTMTKHIPVTPAVLYHHTSPDHRESITKNGLQLKHSRAVEYDEESGGGAIYLTTAPIGNLDVWQVDVKGISLELDHEQHLDGETWWVAYEDIPPRRLTLATP